MCQAITEGRSLDVIEIDAASNTGVDNIRDLRERANYAPSEARYKVYIIDEVHMLSTSASNALLKTLEEPPPHVIFVLATTEVHKVLPTIVSRCQRFDFRRLSQKDVVAKLDRIGQAEGINVEPAGLRLMARSAAGSLRDAENLLEQLTTYYGSDVKFHQVQAILGVTGDERVKELVRHIIGNDVAAGMDTITSVSRDGLDLKQFGRELVEYLRALLLVKTGSDGAVDLTEEDTAELKGLAAKASLARILRVVKLFGQLEKSLDYSTLPLELALVDCILPMEGERESPARRSEDGLPRPVGAVPAPVAEAEPGPPVVEAEAGPPVAEAEAGPPVAEAEAGPPVVEAEPGPPVAEAEPGPPVAEAEPGPPVAEAEPGPPVAEAEPGPPVAEAEPGPPVVEVEPAPVPEAAGTPPQPGSEIEQLVSNWRQIIEQAPEDAQRTPAIAILRSAGVRPVAFEDDTVVLAFKYPVHKENMEKLQNQQIAGKIISNFIGRPCRVRCIHQPENNHLLRAAMKLGAQVTSVEEK